MPWLVLPQASILAELRQWRSDILEVLESRDLSRTHQLALQDSQPALLRLALQETERASCGLAGLSGAKGRGNHNGSMFWWAS